MNNLARIVSHGFAIVVVVILGIGFIYRGQLFPDLELPDFLVPESAKVAGSGEKPAGVLPGRSTAVETAADETARAPSSEAAGEESAPVIPAGQAKEKVTGTIAANPPSETSHETAPGSIANETAGEGRQPDVEAVPPPGAEETVSGEGSTGGEPGSNAMENGISPAPAIPTESPVEPQVGSSGSNAGTQTPPRPSGMSPASGTSAMSGSVSPAPAIPAETPNEPQSEGSGSNAGTEIPSTPSATSPESETSATGSSVSPAPAIPTESPVESQEAGGSGSNQESYPVAEPQERMGATPEGTTAPGSSPVTTERTPPGGTTVGQPTRIPPAAKKPYELLAAAREAFWLHNYEDAEKNYRALTELEPENPDGYGELGNMYFSQGRWEEAAAAYYDAGIRLVREGHIDRARELVSVIRRLNGKQADELEKLISSAATPEGND